ncbi:MAG: aminotransferase class V-fold PLP-dependent enzyme, partial [Patescibacteria group bacterium]
VSTLRCYFLAFSLHKMYGPMGLGVLFVSENRYREMEPMLVGGGSVRTTDLTRVDYVKPPHLFEAGTPPVAEVVGGMKAIEYLSQIGYDVIRGHEAKLTRMLFEGFKKFPFIRVMSPEEGNVGVVSFVVDGLHPHDVGSLLGEEGVALRVGHHCAIPLHQFFGIHGTARVSLGLYNDEKDIVRFFEALRKIEKII